MSTGTPLQLTITPAACPWGFNTANRAPTELEQQQHQLCLMEQAAMAADASGQPISADTRSLLDSLWADLQTVWNWIVSGVDAAAVFVGNLIQSLWDGIGLAWQALQRELASLQNWAILILILAAAFFFAPEIGEGIGNARHKKL